MLRAYRSDGDIRARDRLVTLYLPLVETFAHRYRRPGAEYDDLVQAGSIGLLNAIERYDPARGDEFAAFAVPTIVGEIKRHIRDRSAVIRLPRPLQDAAARLPPERDQLTAALGREPTDAELAAALGVDPVDLARLRDPAPAPLPDEPGTDDAADDRVALAGAFDVLDDDERAAVYLVYVKDLDQRGAAAQLGISERQLARRTRTALQKLRDAMESPGTARPASHDAPTSEASAAGASPPERREASTVGAAARAASAAGPAARPRKAAAGHSGRLLLRMPQTLHAELARAAERDETSLNQYIVNSLADTLDGREETGAAPPRWLRAALIVNSVVLVLAALAAVVLLVVVWNA